MTLKSQNEQAMEDLRADGGLPEARVEPRTKPTHIGAPACFSLELAARVVVEAFPEAYGCYVVGSVLERSDWRDVDLRMIMPDEAFAREFPDAHAEGALWENDARWLLLTTSISAWLSARTGLPVDFQFQPQTFANARHAKPRHAIGMKYASARSERR